MSSPLRIALVAEGVTDYLVLNAAIEAMLGERSFTLNLLQPEHSVAFTGTGDAGSLGGGWLGVWKSPGFSSLASPTMLYFCPLLA